MLEVHPTERLAVYQAALQEDDADLRSHAVNALGELGAAASPAIPQLLVLLESDDFDVFAEDAVKQIAPHDEQVRAALRLDRPPPRKKR